MGDEVAVTTYTREDRQRYREKVRQDLDVFEQMLAQSVFDFERPLIGMEIELNLVDESYQPRMTNAEVLERIADPGSRPRSGSTTSSSTSTRDRCRGTPPSSSRPSFAGA